MMLVTAIAAGMIATEKINSTIIPKEMLPPMPPGWDEPVGNGKAVSIQADRGTIDSSDTATARAMAATMSDPSIIYLKSGWNFISVPRWLAEGHNTALQLFGSVDMASHSILYYNASTGRWDQFLANTVIKPLDGFWVYSVSPIQIQLYFSSTQNIPHKLLYPGFNSIGFWDIYQACARDDLLCVDPDWVHVTEWNADIQRYETRITNLNYDNQRLMYPTKGYYLYMNAARDMTYPIERYYYVCGEGINQYNGHGTDVYWSIQHVNDFVNSIDQEPYWIKTFVLTNNNSMERHWKDPSRGGADSTYIDNAKFAYFNGHGSPTGLEFGTQQDDFTASYADALWGDTMLDWVVIDACQVLRNDSYTNWYSSFEGLHSICGFDSLGNDAPGRGQLMADRIRLGYTIKESWFYAADYTQPGVYKNPAILAADIDGNLNTPDCIDDHIYGRGSSINPPGDPISFKYEKRR
jgi:hypothetical protein